MFNDKEQEIINWGLKNGKSKEQVTQAIANFRSGTVVKKEQEQPVVQGRLEETGEDIKQIASEAKQALLNRASNIQDSIDAEARGEQGRIRTVLQNIGQGGGLVSDLIGSVFKGGVKAVLPQEAETSIKETISKVATPIAQSDVVQNVMSRYQSLDEKTKRDIDAAIGISSLAADVLGAGLAKKGATTGAKATAELATDIAQGTGKAIARAGDVASDVSRTAKGIVKPIVSEISEIPGRAVINTATREAREATIKELPSKIAQSAVRNGVDIADVKYLYSVPKEQKGVLKQLFQSAQDFTSGKSKTNPIEVVGKPIVSRLKQLDAKRVSVGSKLGEVANDLGNVSSNELMTPVFGALKKIPGLEGLRVGSGGKLDFTDTVLATAETAADRKAIQRIFLDAVKPGTGKQKHLLRQELFESLGGKKSSMTALTATQDKAYNAIRQGVSTVLESKNPLYKTLSNEYRKIIQPLTDMRKLMKGVVGADEDILNMSAGLLARRLTSNAQSGPAVKNILRALDNATKVAGKTTVNVENLQDFYNVLAKYYDIVGETTLKGQVGLGIETIPGVREAVTKTVTGLIGKTDAVKRKAIEDAILDALK